MKKVGFLSVAITALALLQACGGNPPPPPVTPYGAAGLGNCVMTPGTVAPTTTVTGQPYQGALERIVTGNLGGGATLTLYISSQAGGTISASGRLVIPSVLALYQDPNLFVNPTPTLSAGGIDECVTTNGSVGVISRGSVYEEVELALRGTQSFVELGSRYGVSTYIVNEYLEGSAWIELPGRAGSVFPMVRPD